jgi:hypothetical protein
MAEKIGIRLDIFPDFTGKRVERDIKIDDKFKFECGLPIPTNEAQCQELYAISFDELVARGVLQVSYGKDDTIGNTIREDLEKKTLIPAELKDAKKYTQIFQDELSTPRAPRGGKKSEVKILNSALKAEGVDVKAVDPAILAKAIKDAMAKTKK